jgi:hypothetical protein
MLDDIKKIIVDNTPSAFVILRESDDFGALYNVIVERDSNNECVNAHELRKAIPSSVGRKKIILTYVPMGYISTFKLKERDSV